MKSKLLCHADNEREDERTDKRERSAVIDLTFAFISRTQEKHEEKGGGEGRHKSEDKQRPVVRN
jgi:hypothetical protein